MSRSNVGNVRVEAGSTSVRICQNTPNPLKLDCHLTFAEAQALARLLLNLTQVVDDFEDLL